MKRQPTKDLVLGILLGAGAITPRHTTEWFNEGDYCVLNVVKPYPTDLEKWSDALGTLDEVFEPENHSELNIMFDDGQITVTIANLAPKAQ